MTDTQTEVEATLDDMERAEQLVERLLGSFTAGVELLTVELGRRLGLYHAVHAIGPVTADALAREAAIDRRYAREWLEQQGAAGFLDVHDVDGEAGERTYALPAAHVPVLLDEEHPAHLMGVAPLLLGTAQALPAVASAVVAGGGVPFADFGGDFRQALAALNRPGFTHGVRGWVEALPDITMKLDRGGLVLDTGCGEGWSTIGIATAFPKVRVVGVDLDEASVEQARRNAVAAGLADRVTFVAANAADESALRAAVGGDPVTLVTTFQALHDMGRPADALAAFRSVLAPGGAVLVGDEAGAESYAAPGTENDRLQYAMSILHCLPATWAEDSAHPNGTVLRPATVENWARAAGFAGTQVLDLEHPFWRFYRL